MEIVEHQKVKEISKNLQKSKKNEKITLFTFWKPERKLERIIKISILNVHKLTFDNKFW